MGKEKSYTNKFSELSKASILVAEGKGAKFSGIPNRSSTIVCIGVQWNHSDLSGCAPKVGSGRRRYTECIAHAH